MAKQETPSLTGNWTTLILAVTALVAVVSSILVIKDSNQPLEKLKVATGYALLIFLFLLSMTVVLDIIRNKIDLSGMLEELSGGASMSRFQLLVFTFVIAFSFFAVVVSLGKFPDIPTNVLTMLGISASTYAVSKGLQVSSGQVEPADEESASAEPTMIKPAESKNQ